MSSTDEERSISSSSRPQRQQRSQAPAREERMRGPQQQVATVGRTPPSPVARVLEPHQYRDHRARKQAADASAKPQAAMAAVAPAPLDARAQARKERLARIRAMVPDQTVRVTPRDENIRKLLRHPLRGRGFPSTGSVEWPLDTFTRRRLRDGDVTLA
jgi:hypothetical protein